MKSNGKNKAEKSIIRSSAAEYLTFITAPGEGGIEAIYADENVWLTQKMMGVLYNVQTHTINYHLKKVFSDGEIDEESATRNFRITATDGKMYDTKHYNLKAIIVVWYKVNSERAVQFRKWATSIIEEFTVKAYVMDEWATSNASSSTSLRFFALLVAWLLLVQSLIFSSGGIPNVYKKRYLLEGHMGVNSQIFKQFLRFCQRFSL